MNLMTVKKIGKLPPKLAATIYFRVNPELGTSMNIRLDVGPIFKIKA